MKRIKQIKRTAIALLAAMAITSAQTLSVLATTQTTDASETNLNHADAVAVLTDGSEIALACGYDTTTGELLWTQTAAEEADARTEYSYENGQLTVTQKSVTGLWGGLDSVFNRYRYEGDRLVSVTHSATNDSETEYRFTYDDEGRVVQTQAGDHTLATCRYYNVGDLQCIEATYGNGAVQIRTYDGKGNLLSERWNDADGTETYYTYDAAGNCVSIQQNGTSTTATYNAKGQMLTAEESTDAGIRRMEWEYDLDGNLTAITETRNGQSQTYAFYYDADGRTALIMADELGVVYSDEEEGRLRTQEIVCSEDTILTHASRYAEDDDGKITSRVAEWGVYTANENRKYQYSYDTNGNIVAINDGTDTTRYQYDEAGQLVREDNEQAGKTWVWCYDAGGNIRSKTEYDYTEGEPTQARRVIVYDYDKNGWSDLLLSYDGDAVKTDEIGNRLSDGVWQYTWTRGQRLASMQCADTTLNFTYDANGLRTQKQVNGINWTYYYVGEQLIGMSSDTDVLRFGYDAEGAALMEWNGALYCYMRNAQGDIIGLTDMNGQIVVEYTYDAWGVPLSVTGNLAQTVGQINPLRYRGYCYDTESGLYYLNSRYYDPQMGRFISADANIAAPNGELLGNNLFIYGFNDPVNTIDPQGTWPRWITVCVGAIATVVKAKTSAAEAALTAVVTGALYRLQVIHYDLRQSLNENLPATREEAQEEGWLGPDTDPVGPSSLLHQFTAKIFGENSKYVSPDGLREAIYDKWGNLIADQRDVGTYNFAPAGTWWDNIKHTLLDVFPWLVFGNGDDDPGPLVDTIWMFINRN